MSALGDRGSVWEGEDVPERDGGWMVVTVTHEVNVPKATELRTEERLGG